MGMFFSKGLFSWFGGGGGIVRTGRYQVSLVNPRVLVTCSRGRDKEKQNVRSKYMG